MNSAAERRLRNEFAHLVSKPVHGVEVDVDSVEKNIFHWIIKITGAQATIYEGEEFQLQFIFNDRYPFDSPIVTFVGTNIPVHHHIYSNGHICLSILTTAWTPALSVESVCLSILSMLSSAKFKQLPQGNESYVNRCSSNPKSTNWLYHDDDV